MPRPKKESRPASALKKRGRKPKNNFMQPAAPARPAAEPMKKKVETPETLKGFKDVLSLDAVYWQYVMKAAEKLSADFGFRPIITPTLEYLALFKRSLGKYSDVVEKEMFEFEDKGGDMVALRPEGTAGVARAFINHGMHNLPQPVKLYYTGSMFRYENPQSGRLREHHQVGFEIFGAASPAADAELILIGSNLMKDLGIGYSLQINSIGCPTCREAYKNALTEYYKTVKKNLCEDCKRRMAKNPLRLLDCKEPSCQEPKAGAPHLVDYLDEECKKHFEAVLEILDELEVPYNMNPFLVRGLDYYTRTVFEFWPTGEVKSQSSLLNGGRYDGLIEELGGLPTPAVGFGAGIERLILRIKDEGVVVPAEQNPDIFLAHLGLDARKKVMSLFEKMRAEKFKVAANFCKDSLKQQLETANKLKVKIAVIIGQKELQEKSALLRDMDAGTQETVEQKKLFDLLRRKLETQSLTIAENEVK
jgi:histidyl-tRNA synthetase